MSDSQNWTASDLRAALVEKASKNAVGARPEILSAPTRQTALALQNYVMYYDADDPENPDEIEDDDMYQILFSRLETLTAWDATRAGDVSSMRGIAGSQYDDDRVDLAKWKQYEVLKDLWRQEPVYDKEFTNKILQTIIMSNQIPPTGRGKSNWLYSLIQFGLLEYPDARVMTNNTSDPFETTPEQWADLEQEIRNHDGWMILGIDEAAQFLQYADQGSGKAISKRLKLLRHNQCHVIMVAHTGIDIPADIRRQVFIMNKLDQKTTQLGYGIKSMKNDDRMAVANELYRFTNTPATDIEYDDIDDEGIEIKFDKEEQSGNNTAEKEDVDTDEDGVDTDERDAVIDYLTSDEGFRPVSERHSISHEKLRTLVKKYDRESE